MENQNNSHQNNPHQDNPHQNNSHQNSPRKHNLIVLIVCALLIVVAIIIMWMAIADITAWPKCEVPKEVWGQEQISASDAASYNSNADMK